MNDKAPRLAGALLLRNHRSQPGGFLRISTSRLLSGGTHQRFGDEAQCQRRADEADKGDDAFHVQKDRHGTRRRPNRTWHGAHAQAHA
jgi:hypothetical protein